MFKLRVSNTLLNLSIAFLLSGPGICVWMIGPLGSSAKNGCSPLSATAAAAAEAYRRRSAIGKVLETLKLLTLKRHDRTRPALRRSEAMMIVARQRARWGIAKLWKLRGAQTWGSGGPCSWCRLACVFQLNQNNKELEMKYT
jgi:hypothetical protein